jgi:hypothetical protein
MIKPSCWMRKRTFLEALTIIGHSLGLGVSTPLCRGLKCGTSLITYSKGISLKMISFPVNRSSSKLFGNSMTYSKISLSLGVVPIELDS